MDKRIDGFQIDKKTDERRVGWTGDWKDGQMDRQTNRQMGCCLDGLMIRLGTNVWTDRLDGLIIGWMDELIGFAQTDGQKNGQDG